jgi:hypothetical protein
MKTVNIKEKDGAERKGFLAGKKGDPSNKCPYKKAPSGFQTTENMCYRVWMSGWFRGRIEYKRNKCEHLCHNNGRISKVLRASL